jgi:hypothetical protein
VQNNPVNEIDPYGLSPAGWIIKLTKTGFRKLNPIKDVHSGADARKKGLNVLAKNKKTAKDIETKAFGQDNLLKHKGHPLEGGKRGRSHYQTDGQYGHTFWGTFIGFLTLFDPTDAISGELSNPEEDSDGNSIPDYLEPAYTDCK